MHISESILKVEKKLVSKGFFKSCSTGNGAELKKKKRKEKEVVAIGWLLQNH